MIDTIRHTIGEITPRQIRHFSKFKNIGDGHYTYNYQNIHFVYYQIENTLLIFTNTHTLLDKKDITLNDYAPYMDRLRRILNIVVGPKFKLKLNRIDYYTNLVFETNQQLDDVCKLLQLYPRRYKHMKATKQYDTSLHLHTKNKGQKNMVLYNKSVESGYNKRFDKTLRIEIQYKKKFLQNQLENFGVDRQLKNYWSKDTFQEFYLDLIFPFLMEGDHYKLENAQKIVATSSYTPTIRRNLCEFLEDINQYGMEDTKHLYSKNTIQRNIERLGELGINPITIPKGCKSDYIPSLLEMVKKETKKLFYK